MTDPDLTRKIAEIDYADLRGDAQDRLPLLTQIALAALNGLLLANGGAIVALFTLIGNSKESNFSAGPLWWSFGFFAVGVTSTLTAHILGYLTQSDYYQFANHAAANAKRRMHDLPEEFQPDKYNDRGGKMEIGAIVACILGVITFITGSGFALGAGLMRHAPTQIVEASLSVQSPPPARPTAVSPAKVEQHQGLDQALVNSGTPAIPAKAK